MSLTDLQDEIVRQSTQRLVAEDEIAKLDSKLRAAQRLISQLEASNTELQHKVAKSESEIADLSTSLLDEASRQVEAANRKTAAAMKLVSERDDVIQSQNDELQALKQMLERESTFSKDSNELETKPIIRNMVFGPNDLPDPQLLLDLDAYSSPIRPLLRSDLNDFHLFKEIYNCDTEHSNFFPRLDNTPAWRKPKFISRAIQEDIEPTLRLDSSPHLGWLICRAFTHAVLEQTLSIEPVSAREMPWSLRPAQPCLLCGEKRVKPVYARQYWAKIPNEEAVVLDLTCVAKVRLVCEFVQFLKLLCRSPKPEIETLHKNWEKVNLMKEQLFWARIGALFPEDYDHITQAEVPSEGAQGVPQGVPNDVTMHTPPHYKPNDLENSIEFRKPDYSYESNGAIDSQSTSISTSPNVSPQLSPQSSFVTSPVMSLESSPRKNPETPSMNSEHLRPSSDESPDRTPRRSDHLDSRV